ncbi:MAG: FAD-binding oxidoreductase [Deltaproteobacteria bacterium]|nr:FAD-binding oxidoreductase [Deltaproteobacteria bacterium]
MHKKYDAIIIGAGVIGAALAFELAKKGYATLNVDKLPSAGYGSTSGSCAVIRLHYSTPNGVAMAREGYYYWLNWPEYLEVMDELGLVTYINKGCLVIKTKLNKYLINVMASLDDLGVDYEELDIPGIKKKVPFLDIRQFFPVKLPDDADFGMPTGDAVAGAIFVPESGYISDPQLSTHNLQRAAEAKGAEFLFNAEVVDIRKKDDRVAGITLKDETRIDAPILVNVTGPHSYIINRMAGVEEGMHIKTRALRQEVCHVPAPDGIDYQKEGILISDGDIGCYSRPETGNHILVGSEDPECDEREWVDPDNYNRSFSEQWTAQVMREAQRIEGLTVPNQRQGVVDLYDVSDDWIPIYDKSDLAGFYMAVGTSGNQYKNAPVVGVMMAELIDKVEAGHDHDKDPIQFYMKHTGRMFNLGFFSRLREINQDSSFSVIG